MSAAVTSDDIARIEEHIESLRDSIARCRKLALAAKFLIGAGAVVLIITVMTLIAFNAGFVIAALAAVIGGIVLAGSNATTTREIEARLHNSELMRAEMIEQLGLHVVGKESPALH
jgi:uncharacterized oligopeptide transporter (OPT) family protein